MKRFSLPLFILGVVLTGWVIGYFNIPGPWYAALVKPSFNPPSWIFGPMWTFLYVLIAVAGWRTWRSEGMSRAFKLWILQMGLNFAWSPMFFTLQRMDLALGILVALLVSIVVFTHDRWGRDRTSTYLFLPYAAWVSFAGVLNLSLLLLN